MDGDKDQDNKIDLGEFKTIFQGIIKMELQTKKAEEYILKPDVNN